MYRRAKNSILLADTMITEHPEVRAHLAHLQARHRRMLAGSPPRQRKVPAATAHQQFTITLPLSAEFIAAVKAAKAEGTLHIDMTLPGRPVRQDTPERRPRRIVPPRKAEGPAEGETEGFTK